MCVMEEILVIRLVINVMGRTTFSGATIREEKQLTQFTFVRVCVQLVWKNLNDVKLSQ